MQQYLNLVLDNLDTILVIVGAIIALVRMTAWGKANKAALDTVTEAIEQLDAKEVKEKVSTIQADLPAAAANALQDAVRKVDASKKTPGLMDFLAEITMLRGRQKP